MTPVEAHEANPPASSSHSKPLDVPVNEYVNDADADPVAPVGPESIVVSGAGGGGGGGGGVTIVPLPNCFVVRKV